MSQIGDGGHERREQRCIYHRTHVARRQELDLHDDHLEQENGDAQDGAKLEPNRNPAEPCASSLHETSQGRPFARELPTQAVSQPRLRLTTKGSIRYRPTVINSLAPRTVSSRVQYRSSGWGGAKDHHRRLKH